jgi:hypothetical protein
VARRAKGTRPRAEGSESLLTVDLSDLDFRLRLFVDADKLVRNVGRRLATKVKKAIKRGTTYDGRRSDYELDQSGELLKGIRYHKWGAVAPSTRRRKDVSDKAWSSYGLIAILTSEPWATAHGAPVIDPFGAQSKERVAKDVAELTAKDVARQVKKGEAGLIKELRNSAKGRRR